MWRKRRQKKGETSFEDNSSKEEQPQHLQTQNDAHDRKRSKRPLLWEKNTPSNHATSVNGTLLVPPTAFHTTQPTPWKFAPLDPTAWKRPTDVLQTILEDGSPANIATYVLLAIVGLLVLARLELRLFSKPPPVPRKKLPRRPALSILFKPDEPPLATNATVANSMTETTSITKTTVPRPKNISIDKSFEVTGLDPVVETVREVFLNSSSDVQSSSHSAAHHARSISGSVTNVEEDDLFLGAPETPRATFDLPDSFAPLLSSSETEMLLDHLTADILHGVHAEASVHFRAGRHEIPLDKDPQRPQFTIDIPKEGIKLSAMASVGSEGFSKPQDLDTSIPTTKRSRPMVKRAELVFEPPVPLLNVAPTLIHIPTLFEDRSIIPRLRKIPVFRYLVDGIAAISSLIEKILWVIERRLQIHLGKVRIVPVYKGRKTVDGGTTPEWRLSLAFSGHVQAFGLIPVPFLSVVLPTFIIPQPHALLEYLLSKQPLASARIKRENIAEERIAIALLDTVEKWTTQADVVATPPAVGIDLTLPGGVSLGLELLHGRDATAGRNRQDPAGEPGDLLNNSFRETMDPSARMPLGSGASMSSWTTNDQLSGSDFYPRTSFRNFNTHPYDANLLVPWKMGFSAKGSMEKEKMTFHLLKCSFEHNDPTSLSKSLFETRGSFAVWKAGMAATIEATPLKFRKSPSYVHRAALAGATESPSVSSILLFPDESESFHREYNMLQYDYAFDVSEDSKIDAITLSVGANHPMLNGGSMVTTILESIFAFGSVSARQDAILDPLERRRKRNILRHLPAIDFTCGLQNSYIPPESQSYTNDGQTRTLPEMEGGRMMVRFLGGIQEESESRTVDTGLSIDESEEPMKQAESIPVAEGIKAVANFSVASILLNSETIMKEFPELDIFEGTRLRTVTSSKVAGVIQCHLRPQQLHTKTASTMGPNIFNPLEAYEIDCSGSALSMRIKESMTSLGHRRVIIPAETTVKIKVVESVVDMTMEGRSECELSWDFQGLSPILQVTEVGLNPESVMHERKEQVSLLIAPLRQGRLNFHVSPVGGISITKAATSREDKEGLYDWKFFNALVSPDDQSAERLMDVIHDKRSMNKLLQVIKLVNNDAHKVARYVLDQVWRLKEILDKEGVSDPKHIIPGHRMARLISLLLCDDLSEANVVLPLIRRVVAGDGLDVVAVKDLLAKHCNFYDDWTPEIDRAVRWVETMFSPTTVPPPYVENNVTPLAQEECYASKFRSIPSAAQIYDQINDRLHLTLDKRFSNLVGRIVPYLSFHQIEYFLKRRSAKDWQPSDLKRLRYVYSVKKRVMDIAESYGGLSFLPQSFLVSVFLGEATRSSLRVSQPPTSTSTKVKRSMGLNYSNKPSTLAALRQRRSTLKSPRMSAVQEEHRANVTLSAAGRVASLVNLARERGQEAQTSSSFTAPESMQYELGDCLLGPADVAILLQAGLTSVMKGSSVVQLNQRMLLDLVASQPKTFAVAVLAEIGTPGGQGGPRQLTSALLALLELDQTSFRPIHRLDMHALLESWLPGLKVPKREDYMAGGRWARQSYYNALFTLSNNILEDAECYMALKNHLQRVRHWEESDPLPKPKSDQGPTESVFGEPGHDLNKLTEAVASAKDTIALADRRGHEILQELLHGRPQFKKSTKYCDTISAYKAAFQACARVHDIDRLAFHSDWFRSFYKRNYNALMIKSIYDNVMNDDDNVRYWMHCLRRGARFGAPRRNDHKDLGGNEIQALSFLEGILSPLKFDDEPEGMIGVDRIFLEPNKHNEQKLIDAIIDAIVYEPKAREHLRKDPLVRLLIENAPGHYDFAVVTAMGVITDGKKGTELHTAMDRLYKTRGVTTVRADTATARSLEYNASKIIDAIETVRQLNVPYGLLGYSQGCANALMAETLLYSGTPDQQQQIGDSRGLVSRQLLFSAANASIHGPAMDLKVKRLTVQVEEFFKYQQGYFSRALQSAFIEALTTGLDSPQFHKMMGGAQTFLSDGCRAFWREAQHLAHVPTCTIRGVLEEHTTPEALEMLTNMLSKQSGSALHDSQVHVYDAVGHPVYFHNRNGQILEKCDVGQGEIQRTHHWSPLNEEVDFIATQRDAQMASFDCAKDRHLFPWVEVNARFGFIKYSQPKESTPKETVQ